jgi:hypothetical protein
MLTQYNLKQGVQRFSDQGKQAVMAELQQLYDRDVMEPISKSNLTHDKQCGALRYIMFAKEKRCGKIQGRGCANGRPQRDNMTKEDTSSLTVATEALILLCMIDATKHQDVATCNISGTFVQSKMEGKVIMKIKGVMALIIQKMDPNQYKKHTIYEQGKPGIYMILRKAPYRTLQAALVFWENLLSQLQEWGFKLNPYDFCITNKIINNKQCAIAWHVDDLKISHVDPQVVTTSLNLLDGKYRQEIVRGKQTPVGRPTII